MKRPSSVVIALLLAGTVISPVSATTLREALAKAYDTNPTLSGARAEQRANDENVPIARSRGLPSADLQGVYDEDVYNSQVSNLPAGIPSTSPVRSVTGRVSVTVPLYTGGGVKNSVLASETRVLAGRAGLRGTESSLFSAVVAAYMNVISNQSIVALNRAQVGVLDVNLKATKDRFEVGDLTRTDIAQSEARLARAQAQFRAAESDLIGSREQYVRLVGDEPVNLEQPPELPNLPATPSAAVEKTLSDNPDLIATALAAKASGFDIKTARASRLPTVAGVASGSYSDFLGSIPAAAAPSNSKSIGAGVQASFPLFQGGAAGAQIRQAQARLSQAQERVIEVERGVIAQTRSAYAAWRASNDVIRASNVAVSANKLALEGVRAENSVGTRTILDILDAEQELLNSEVQLVRARRDAYVAGFSLLAAMGDAEYVDLGLEGGKLYDPESNYRRVRKKIWDWSNDPDPKPESSRTVDIPAQTPEISPLPRK